MKRDTVVRMARKAGIAQYGLGFTCWEGQLERFADLVAQHERGECAELAGKVEVHYRSVPDVRKIMCAIQARGGK